MVSRKNVKVFVYGSLKAGHDLHVLLENCRADWIGRDFIEEPMLLCNMGAFPALVDFATDTDDKYKTFGEVYTVDQEGLASLDFAEGVPMLYNRSKVKTNGGHTCWVYTLSDTMTKYADDILEDGVWEPSAEEDEYVRSFD